MLSSPACCWRPSVTSICSSPQAKQEYVKNLNETGVWFWQLFEKQLDLAQIEQQAIQTFHISAEQAHNALTAFFGKLQNDGYLIVPKE